MVDSEDVMCWTCSDVCKWLCEEGLECYQDLFCEIHQLDGKGLLLLCENDLRRPPMEIRVLGDIKRIVIALNNLKRRNCDAVMELSGVDTSSSMEISSMSCNSRNSHHLDRPIRTQEVPRNRRKQRIDSDSSMASDCAEADRLYTSRMSSHLKPEYLKCILSYFYMFLVFLLTSFVMVIVHDRVPDMEKYPPLPDLVLDNLPVIPWAFEMCELTASLLFVILAITMFFHKHRFIIMRRLFSLTGTIFLLRCITMLITSLSVPGTHLKCEPRAYEDLWVRLERTFTIWKGFGMSLKGVRTCGDYMFSGHTAVVTMLNFFITEYTPRKIYFLHTATWVMNIFGIFFILAAHEHYSIDVFVSFYLTSRLFLYYHSLANNRALWQPDHKRMWIWFPMFSYFESKMDGILPNEYEWPLPSPQQVFRFFQSKLKRS